MKTQQLSFLNRFTTIPFLIDLLTRRKLVLLNPNTWEDYNDRTTMELYRKRKNVASIYALCLSDTRETIHHWSAFANGPGGCCIEFDFQKLLESFSKISGAIHGKTEYVKINDLPKLTDDVERLPYVKRKPFEAENEYRLAILSDRPQQMAFDVDLDINTIRRITLSSKLPDIVFLSLKQALIKISPDCKGKIFHSTLFNNSKWTSHFSKLAEQSHEKT